MGTMPRYIAIDYGSRRIGLAVGDDQSEIATPLKTIAAAGNPQANAAAVLRCVRDYEVDAFVVGLPLNMDGTEGPQPKPHGASGTRWPPPRQAPPLLGK